MNARPRRISPTARMPRRFLTPTLNFERSHQVSAVEGEGTGEQVVERGRGIFGVRSRGIPSANTAFFPQGYVPSGPHVDGPPANVCETR